MSDVGHFPPQGADGIQNLLGAGLRHVQLEAFRLQVHNNKTEGIEYRLPFGTEYRVKRCQAPLIPSIVGTYLLGSAIANARIRLHPDRFRQLHSNGDVNNLALCSLIHCVYIFYSCRTKLPCFSTSPRLDYICGVKRKQAPT